MLDEYYIVSKKILPDVYLKVIEAKKLIDCGICPQVSDAVKKVGISRSAYYKYKDYIYEASMVDTSRKAVISFVLTDEKGRLSEVLNTITSMQCNIITINQDIPIHRQASVTISMDLHDIDGTMDELLNRLAKTSGVSRVQLITME